VTLCFNHVPWFKHGNEPNRNDTTNSYNVTDSIIIQQKSQKITFYVSIIAFRIGHVREHCMPPCTIIVRHTGGSLSQMQSLMRMISCLYSAFSDHAASGWRRRRLDCIGIRPRPVSPSCLFLSMHHKRSPAERRIVFSGMTYFWSSDTLNLNSVNPSCLVSVP